MGIVNTILNLFAETKKSISKLNSRLGSLEKQFGKDSDLVKWIKSSISDEVISDHKTHGGKISTKKETVEYYERNDRKLNKLTDKIPTVSNLYKKIEMNLAVGKDAFTSKSAYDEADRILNHPTMTQANKDRQLKQSPIIKREINKRASINLNYDSDWDTIYEMANFNVGDVEWTPTDYERANDEAIAEYEAMMGEINAAVSEAQDLISNRQYANAQSWATKEDAHLIAAKYRMLFELIERL